jgi:hypothetical protein
VSAIKPSVVSGLVMLISALAAFAQQGSTPAREDNLYSVTLFASLSEMEKSWGHIDDSDHGSGIRTDYHRMPVQKDNEITDGLPSEIGDYRVEYLDWREEIDRFKRLRKEYSILKIHAMHNDGTRLKIQISVYYLSYKKQKLYLGLSGWSEVDFRYDCETQKYIVSSVKLGGI